MIDESALKDALLALAEQNKTQYLMLSAAVNELAALRETVRGLDPTFADVLEREQNRAADSTREIVALQVGVFDSIIQRLKYGEVC